MPPIFSWLAADAGVLVLIQSGGITRAFRDEAIPDRATGKVLLPYLRWTLAGGRPENHLADRPNIDSARIQFDAFATTAAGADALYEAVRDVLEDYGHTVSFNGSERDLETRNYRVSWDMEFWTNRASAIPEDAVTADGEVVTADGETVTATP